MSATSKANMIAKPPRPCTEYNIFFQLERAYILQVTLGTEPTIDDAADVFHTSQVSYAGLPQLPRRYASLVLPYDWHLPGKERRRKRKHRKTHGAIGFHDLSNRIANAWKFVDNEVQAYCAQVCAVGMIRYKAAMKEWKMNGGQLQLAPQKNDLEKTVEMTKHELPMQVVSEDRGFDIGEKKKPEVMTSNDQYFNVMFQGFHLQEMMQRNEVSSPVISRDVTLEEMNKAFENDMVLMGDDYHGIWNTQVEPLAFEPNLPLSTNYLPLTNAVSVLGQEQNRETTDKQGEYKSLRNSSIVSYGDSSIVSNEHVDMDDNEIIGMWKTSDHDNMTSAQYCYDCTPVASNVVASNTVAHNVVCDNMSSNLYDTMFGVNGYAQTMQEMRRLKSELEQQMAQMEYANRPLMAELECANRPVRRRSIVACSA